MTGKNLTMKIDSGLSRTIVNEGEQEYMELDEALYIGGLPAAMKDTTLKKWHVRNTASLIGKLYCFFFEHSNQLKYSLPISTKGSIILLSYK